MINPEQLEVGQVYFTTRGICEIQDFYTEAELQKVRFKLHVVDKSDGVTPIGNNLLMSTTADILCSWINHFPRDLDARKKSILSLKGQYKELKGHCEQVLESIDTAISEGAMTRLELKQRGETKTK